MGAPHDELMPQSSSNRGRENAKNTEDTGIYPGLPTTGNPSEGDPTPQKDPPATTVAESLHPSPHQLREEALAAFIAQPMIPEIE